MQKADYVIAAVAAVALVGSLLGVALYEEPEFRRYDVRAVEQQGSDDVWSTSLTGPGDDDTQTWDLEVRNITHITFTVTIASDASARVDDTVVRVDFTAPNNETGTIDLTLAGDQGSDTDTLEFHFHELPAAQERILARNAGEALLDDGEPRIPEGLNATGTWRLEAACTSGCAIVDPVLGTVISQETVDVEVTAEYHYYQGEARVRLPDPGPVA